MKGQNLFKNYNFATLATSTQTNVIFIVSKFVQFRSHPFLVMMSRGEDIPSPVLSASSQENPLPILYVLSPRTGFNSSMINSFFSFWSIDKEVYRQRMNHTDISFRTMPQSKSANAARDISRSILYV